MKLCIILFYKGGWVRGGLSVGLRYCCDVITFEVHNVAVRVIDAGGKQVNPNAAWTALRIQWTDYSFFLTTEDRSTVYSLQYTSLLSMHVPILLWNFNNLSFNNIPLLRGLPQLSTQNFSSRKIFTPLKKRGKKTFFMMVDRKVWSGTRDYCRRRIFVGYRG